MNGKLIALPGMFPNRGYVSIYENDRGDPSLRPVDIWPVI
jgi:hypothetical protein